MLPLPELDFRRTPVTLIVTAVVVAIEVVCLFDPARRAYFHDGLRLGMLSLVWSGELWRPFTTTLLHVSPWHAAFNVYWTLVFGRALEPYFGSLRYLGLFVLLGYVSSMGSFLLSNFSTPLEGQIAGVGLSGIGYGLFGLLWIGRRWRPLLAAVCDAQLVRLFVGWFLLCIVLTWTKIMPIDNIGHGVGLAFGVLYGLAAFHPRRRLPWTILAVVLSAAMLLTAVACPGHPLYEKQRQLQQLRMR